MDRDTTSIESEEYGLCLDPLDGEAAKMGGPSLGGTRTDGGSAVDGEDDLLELGDLGSGSIRFSLTDLRRTQDGSGDAEAHDAEKVLEPRSPSALLRATHQQGREHSTLLDEESGHADRAPEELAGDGHRIGVKGAEVELDVPEGHRGVDVDAGALCPSGSHHAVDVGHDTGLVVGNLAADQRARVLTKQVGEVLEVEVPSTIDAQLSDRSVSSGGLGHRAAFGSRDEDLATLCQRGHRRVDGFGDRGGEDHLTRRDRGEPRHLVSGVFDQGANDESLAVGAAWIGLGDSEHLVEGGSHLRAEGGDGGVIEVRAH